jgi:outer membrane protein assembly factor BamB
MKTITRRNRMALVAAAACAALLGVAHAAEEDMFGGSPSRNMVSDETGLPQSWDLKTGKNVKWTAQLGSQTYAGPVVADGRVYVGTNNEARRNPEQDGDRGVVMAFDAETGSFLWQAAHPKLPSGLVNDWPLQGVCSTPHVIGDRVYYLSNRAEVICADAEGFRDGENDGPFKEEKDTSELAEDIIWKFNLIGELDVFPHNLAAGSPLVIDGILYVTTGNGVDEGHVNIPSPFGPSFVALNVKDGTLAWENADPGEKILHGTWSNPSYGVVDGRAQVVIPGGDGWIYSFEPQTGKVLWKFNANPEGSKWVLGGRGTKNNVIATPVIHDGVVYVAVGQDPEHGEGIGHLWAIDATKSGDVTKTGLVWHFGDEDFHRTISTVAIKDGLLYAADLSGFLYCLDLKTGKQLWKYDAFAAIWSSPYVADGKVYITDEDGDVAILRAGPKMELLGEINMGNAVYTTPKAHDGVLYVASRTTLFALENGAQLQEPKSDGAAPSR